VLNDGDKIIVSGLYSKGISQSGAGSAITITNSGNSSIIVKDPNSNASGIEVRNNNQFTLAGTGQIDIDVSGTDTYGILGTAGTLEIAPKINMNVVANADNVDCIGIYNWGSNSTFNGDVTVKLQTDYNVVRAYGIENVGSTLTFNGNVDVSVITTKDLTNSWGYASAVGTEYGKTTTFNGDVKVSIQGESASAYMIGINSLFGDSLDDLSTTLLNGKTDISAFNTQGYAIALYTQENAQIALKDSIRLNAVGVDAGSSLAIYATESSIIDLSKSDLSANSADAVEGQINGNVAAEVQSKANINLTGDTSYLTGYITTDVASTTTISLHNQAVLNNTGVSNITNLNMTDGIINQDTDASSSISDVIKLSSRSWDNNISLQRPVARRGISSAIDLSKYSMLKIRTKACARSDGDAELWIGSNLAGHDLGEASITKTAGQTTSIDVSAIAKSSFITIWARSGNEYGNTIDISFDKVWLE